MGEGLEIYNDDMSLRLAVNSRVGQFEAFITTNGAISGSVSVPSLAGKNTFYFPVNIGTDRNAYGGPNVTVDKSNGLVSWQFPTIQGPGVIITPNEGDRAYNIFLGSY